MRKDYYISFSDADEGWASWVAWEVEEAGHSVLFEGWGGRLHGDRVLGLQRALSQADRVLLVLSPDYLAGEATQRELSAALALPPEKILPVRVRPCMADQILPQLSVVDLHGCPRAEARRRLQVALQKAPLRPERSPDFPGTRSFPQEPEFPGPGPAQDPTLHAPAPETEGLQQGLLLDGKWRIEKKLGQGGMGEVWLARHARLGKAVAVKVLLKGVAQNPQVAKRFFTEAQAVARLGLQGLVAMEDYGQLPGGTAYLVMEYLPGESLAQRLLRTSGGLGALGLRLLVQLSDILAAVHRQGVVHRDLKPDNVMVVPDPGMPGGERLKVLDFGIARVASEEGSTAGTQKGVPMGTPAYMAPEQFHDASSVGTAADVYSLGVMLHEVVTGRRPFEARNFPEWVHRHCLVPPPRLTGAGTSAGLADLCAAMLAKQAGARPAAEKVADRLRGLLQEGEGPSGPSAVGRVAAGVALGAVGAGMCVFLLLRPHPTDGAPAADLGAPRDQAVLRRIEVPGEDPPAPKRRLIEVPDE